MLGSRYQRGEGVEKSMKRAVELQEQAASQGSAESALHLGARPENGEGLEKDEKRALELYKRAAEIVGEDVTRFCFLGRHCESGRGAQFGEKRATEICCDASMIESLEQSNVYFCARDRIEIQRIDWL